MSYFQPTITLGRETVIDQPYKYYLHTVINCPRTSYRVGSHSIDASRAAMGQYSVVINLERDANALDLAFDAPLSYSLDLGSIAFPGDNGVFSVVVMVPVAAANNNPPTTTTGGSGTVSTGQANDNPKPIPAGE